MFDSMKIHLARQLDEIRQTGLYKTERVITSPQDARIQVDGDKPVLNLCANNYLGLAEHPAVVQAAREALEQWGYGLSSVRFICGTQRIHKKLEARISEFLGTEDTILYSSCFDANGGLFETLLDAEDAILSDELNHASIIDGVRLCKAQRFRYLNSDMGDLETKLKEARNARFKMIATDGVFSMDGYIANLPDICDLAEKHHALVMVDDSHAVGFMGKTGRGFRILPGTHPIVPVMLGDAALATKVAEAMLRKGVYVIGFSYPVVPKGKARIRAQISAAHSRADLEFAIQAFAEVKRELGL